MADKKTTYPEGIRAFSPHEKAPEFVKGTIILEPNKLINWLKENKDFLKDYKGEKQLRLSLKAGTKGLYLEVDTYEAKEKTFTKDSQDLPF